MLFENPSNYVHSKLPFLHDDKKVYAITDL